MREQLTCPRYKTNVEMKRENVKERAVQFVSLTWTLMTQAESSIIWIKC